MDRYDSSSQLTLTVISWKKRIKRIGFTLIRVHRQQLATVAKSSDEVLLQQLKWPIETLFVGMKIKDYSSTSPALQSEHLDKWYRFCQVTKQAFVTAGRWVANTLALTQTTIAIATTGVITGVGTAFTTELLAGDTLVSPTGRKFPIESVASATAAQSVSGVVTAIGAAAGWSVLRPATLGAHADVMARTVDTLTIKAHGISIYSDFPAGFYNAYVPFHYGGPNIQTPEDLGALMVNFCLYPGTYQPSGHINVSRAREFYLEYASSLISSTNEGILCVIASAINFLLNLLGEKVRIEKILASVCYVILSVISCKTSKLREVPKALSTTLASKDMRGTRLIAETNGKNDKDEFVSANQWIIRSQDSPVLELCS